MTQFVFANNVNTTLASSISSSATSLTLASSANLPSSIPAGEYFALTLNDAATRNNYEIVYATAVSGATLTVVRAQEGTTAQAWATGDFAFSGPTAGQMESFNTGEGVSSFNTRTGAVTLAPGDVTTALGYTPVAPPVVTSFNTRTGAVVLNATDVDNALGYTPANDSLVVHLAGTETITGAKTFDDGITSTTGTFSGAVTTGALTCTTMNASSSDRRLKKDIKPFEPRPLHRVPLVSYTMKDSGWQGVGTIAQAMQKIAPEHVGTFYYHGKTRLSINYAGAAYELAHWSAREIDRQAKLIAKLEARLAKLERRA